MLKLRILKTIVFLLSFLLIFGIIILGMQLIKAGKGSRKPVSEINLNEPSGSQISSVIGNEKELYIFIKGGNKPDRIIIYDTQKQSKVSTITII